MTIADSTPVSGVLVRQYPDGSAETIAFTPDDLQSAPLHYDQQDLQNIEVTLSNGEVVRPWRHIDTSPKMTAAVDTKSGKKTVTII